MADYPGSLSSTKRSPNIPVKSIFNARPLSDSITSSAPAAGIPVRQSSMRNSTFFGVPPSLSQYNHISPSNLICPICQIPQPSLQELNDHLDEEHNNDDVILDNVKNWFKGKLGNFVAATGQKVVSTGQTVVRTLANEPEPEIEDGISRNHWQSDSETNTCTAANCSRILGGRNGKIHCRKCGRLFCDMHCQAQIRLNMQAVHDPENGIWAKVCQDCFQSRDGYFESTGAEKDWTETFVPIRRKAVDKADLARNRLEKRLDKVLATGD